MIRYLLIAFLLLVISCAGIKGLSDIDGVSTSDDVVYYDPGLFGGWCQGKGFSEGPWIYFMRTGLSV